MHPGIAISIKVVYTALIPIKDRAQLEYIDQTVGWDIVLPRLENGQFKDQQIDDWMRAGPDEFS